MNLEELRKPFDPAKISWRVGSTTKDKSKGMALAYIDARDVQDRLDEVCGMDGWQCRYPHANGKTVCEIGVRIGNEWIWKADGAGDSDVEAEKGALSDAFKRAAVRWGVGRYLYDVESPWVELEPAGSSYRIKADQYAKLRAVLGGGKAPAPSKSQTIASDINEATVKARKWADDAIASIRKMTPSALSRWESDNAKTIVRLKDIDLDKHKELMAAMQACDGLTQAAE